MHNIRPETKMADLSPKMDAKETPTPIGHLGTQQNRPANHACFYHLALIQVSFSREPGKVEMV